MSQVDVVLQCNEWSFNYEVSLMTVLRHTHTLTLVIWTNGMQPLGQHALLQEVHDSDSDVSLWYNFACNVMHI